MRKTISNTEGRWIHRQLDDVPIVSPVSSNITESFILTYKNICKDLNIPLAENCPKFEKAFGPSKIGTVLGIRFNSILLSWTLPYEKFADSVNMILCIMEKKSCTILEFQKLHGKLNSFAQMHNFAKFFSFQMNKFLQSFDVQKKEVLPTPVALLNELRVWLHMLFENQKSGFQIPAEIHHPPLNAIKFFSDAAGPAIRWSLCSGKNIIQTFDSGAASIGVVNSKISFVSTITWPLSFVEKYPHSSAVLEAVALLLPFCCNPCDLKNKHVNLITDNISCMFAWENKIAKDEVVNSLLQTLHLFEAALPCKIYITHRKRRSDKFTKIADNCSRISTFHLSFEDIKDVKRHILHGPLLRWIFDCRNYKLNPIEIVKYSTRHFEK